MDSEVNTSTELNNNLNDSDQNLNSLQSNNTITDPTQNNSPSTASKSHEISNSIILYPFAHQVSYRITAPSLRLNIATNTY